jgi:meso-butanediol dehydrogenase/(S,S)-butanediol dehydrogenase/diacetyl reductase
VSEREGQEEKGQVRVALVTGARRGIGRAIALRLAREMDVALNDVGEGNEELEAVAEEVRAMGRRAIAVSADVRDGEQVEGMVKRTVRSWGGWTCW